MQVFIHYGAHSNISLLVEYGFIIPANPDDGICLTLEQLLNAASLSTSSTILQKLREASLHLGIAISPKSGLIKKQELVRLTCVNRLIMEWSGQFENSFFKAGRAG